MKEVEKGATRVKKSYVMSIAMAVLLIGNVAVATIITVNGDGTADYLTIQEAINASSHGDEIIVAPGTYTSTGDRVVDMDGKEITLRSSDGAATTIIDGGGTQRIVYCNSGETNNTIIDGFTITNAGIGGLYCTSDATITNCVFSNNYINGSGGGMAIVVGEPIIDNCTFSYNTAESSGGGIFTNSSHATITNCSFLNNSAQYAGALEVANCNPVLSNCSFVGNTASLYGGAVYINSGSSSPTMSNCTFTSNVAPFGGGIILGVDCSISLVDSNFYTNSSTNETGSQWGGGAIMNLNAHIDLTGCTLDENTATYGGGICNHGGTAAIIGCTFEENIATEGGGMINWHSAVVISDTLFESNTATIDHLFVGGGGIANYSSEVAMTACTLNNNHASNGTGGAMFSQSSSGPMQMTNCTVTNNKAKHSGGGLYAASADMILTDHTSSGNTAVEGDGAGIHASWSCQIVYKGTSSTDEIYLRNFANEGSGLSFNTDAICDVTGDVSTATGGSTTFDINDIDAEEQLHVNGDLVRRGALGVTNATGSLSAAAVGDIIPLAQATTMSGGFSSVTFPLMPSGLGLQLIEQDVARTLDTEVAVKVIEVEEATFSSPFTGDLDSPPLDIESFNADGVGGDEIVVLFEGTPGGIACFSISSESAPVLITGFSATVGNDPVDLDVGDLNGDGFEDVIVANGTSNTVSVFTTFVGTDGSLSFNPEVVLSLSDASTCIAIMDWDDDTSLDAVVGIDIADNNLTDGYQVLLDVSSDSSNGPWFTVEKELINDEPVPNLPTCVDGGEQTDAWGFVGGSQYGIVHRAVATSALQNVAELGSNSNTSTIEALHLDDNTQIDLMAASDNAEMIYLFKGNGEEADGYDDVIPVAVSEPVEDIVALDADFDGDTDIVMLSPSSDTPLVLLRNDGNATGFMQSLDGTVWSKQPAGSGGETMTKVVGGDLDGKDEDDDWLTAVGDSDEDGLFRDASLGTIEQTSVGIETQGCDGDMNNDDLVNIHDLLILIGEWGASDSIADLNADDVVNIHDLLILVGAWGSCN